jgi:hypothetical protein
MRKRKKLPPEPMTRDWLEYVILDELWYHKTLEQFVHHRETEVRLKAEIKKYLDEIPPEELPRTKYGEEFCWMDKRMEELCDRMGVNRRRNPLY